MNTVTITETEYRKILTARRKNVAKKKFSAAGFGALKAGWKGSSVAAVNRMRKSWRA